jgi:nitroimidazol reductase NimA-like FMN-containing flavoprotein (pyridoxamine 5'-phosphate oxidase superfamily)
MRATGPRFRWPGLPREEKIRRMAAEEPDDPAALARAIVDANLYMVLGTADEEGRPWVSPVYYAPAAYREFFWVSRPDARHSLNVAARPEISIVIFDSSVPIGTGTGVYMSAVVDEPAGAERQAGIDVFSRRSLAHGGNEWGLEHVEAPAPLRLYRATAREHYVLGAGDRRIPVLFQ